MPNVFEYFELFKLRIIVHDEDVKELLMRFVEDWMRSDSVSVVGIVKQELMFSFFEGFFIAQACSGIYIFVSIRHF